MFTNPSESDISKHISGYSSLKPAIIGGKTVFPSHVGALIRRRCCEDCHYGDAYIARGGQTGKPDRFVCLIGDKGKVLLTFFTAQ